MASVAIFAANGFPPYVLPCCPGLKFRMKNKENNNPQIFRVYLNSQHNFIVSKNSGYLYKKV